MKLCVAICTRERPKMLRACLASVCAQSVPDWVQAEIVVVENHDRETSRHVAEEVAAETGWAIHYVLEPELGIPFARDRCGTFAESAGFDRVLYIDDDEIAHAGWLETMAEATRVLPAEVHYGRVLYTWPPETPSWMVPEQVNKRPSGTVLTKAEGHNTLVETKVFRAREAGGFGLHFDGSMRFTGGSDTDFFTRVHDAGGRIVWIPDALVEELVPVNRTTLRWQLNRTFRVAGNISRLHEKRAGKQKAALRSLLKGLGRIVGGTFLFIPAAASFAVSPEGGRRRAFKAAKQIASGLGSLAYLAGHQQQPYAKVDGG
ncbi:glycosyltransferase family 2 protein [Stappia sp. 28M-7]|uniref:glycosyltransferase family 2 protein n=1 Tax=Stappia sp. 28M-7 TaxID=2762596 RepID=UPI00163B7356|nr:glycosyltransferase family 2 protein [Stappia sp. 28M-7]MBC2861536.1 glycosyltransferase family 2 protein [Stappia sp. 28M-7]